MKQFIKRALGRFNHEPNIDSSKQLPPLHQAPDMAGHHFLFVGGLHRSGTSVLHRLLRSNPQTTGITDAGVPEDEGQFLQSIFLTGRAMGEEGRFAFSPHAHLTEDADLVNDQARQTLLREWGAYLDLDKPVYLEKSPPNTVKARFLQALFPGSKFVFIVRHPITSSAATMKWTKASFTEVLVHWLVAHRMLMDDLQHLDDYLVFRYEDFIEEPQFYIDRICAANGIDSQVVNEAVEEHNSRYFDSWMEDHRFEYDMLRNYLPEIEAGYRAFGYTIDAPYVTPLAGRFLASTPDSGNAT